MTIFPSRLGNNELLKNTNWDQSQPNEITHVRILCKERYRFKLLPLSLARTNKSICKAIFLGSPPCDWGCVCSLPVLWSTWEKEAWQPSYLVLSSPKQWMDHYSSNYFGKTKMASVALFGPSKYQYFLCLFPHLNLHVSSSASLIVW